ncbi:hypothetical protein D3C80_1540410 [compost metagenome]
MYYRMQQGVIDYLNRQLWIYFQPATGHGDNHVLNAITAKGFAQDAQVLVQVAVGGHQPVVVPDPLHYRIAADHARMLDHEEQQGVGSDGELAI